MSYKGHDSSKLTIHQLSALILNELKLSNYDIKTLCDFGSRHGEAYPELHELISEDAKFIFIEPEQTCLQVLSTIRPNRKQEIIIVDSIVSAAPGTTKLYTFEKDNKQSSNVFSDRSGVYGDTKLIDVNIISYNSFFKEIKTEYIDFVKMNIEGFEYTMIDHGFFHNHVHSFVIELHNRLAPNKSWNSAIDALSDSFDLTTSGNVDYKYCFVRGTRCV